jgi:hypothetical protein
MDPPAPPPACAESYGFLPWCGADARVPGRGRGPAGGRGGAPAAGGTPIPYAIWRLPRHAAQRIAATAAAHAGPLPPRPPPSRSSDNVWGALFLALVYGYVVLRGAVSIGDGGEELMELKLAPAVIGGASPCAG